MVRRGPSLPRRHRAVLLLALAIGLVAAAPAYAMPYVPHVTRPASHATRKLTVKMVRKPAAYVHVTRASFSWRHTGTVRRTTCKLDTRRATSCRRGRISYRKLAAGHHTFVLTVRGTSSRRTITRQVAGRPRCSATAHVRAGRFHRVEHGAGDADGGRRQRRHQRACRLPVPGVGERRRMALAGAAESGCHRNRGVVDRAVPKRRQGRQHVELGAVRSRARQHGQYRHHASGRADADGRVAALAGRAIGDRERERRSGRRFRVCAASATASPPTAAPPGARRFREPE